MGDTDSLLKLYSSFTTHLRFSYFLWSPRKYYHQITGKKYILQYNPEETTHKQTKMKFYNTGWLSQDHISYFIILERIGAKNLFLKV